MRSWFGLVLLAACAQKHATGVPAYEAADDYRENPNMGGGSANENRYMGSDDAPASAPMRPRPPPPPGEPALSEAPVAQRMVHYSGWAQLRVTRVQEALDAIAAEATRRGGRVEQLTASAIVVRVPVADFDAAWAAIRAQGDVLDESVTAEDVTENFLAADLRVRTLTVTRDRLIALLAKAETEQEKLALLHELQRVTEQLDAFERQRRTLQGLADLARISIQLVPREAVGSGAGSSPIAGFEWIAELTPFHRDVGSAEKRLALPVPDGMVALSPKGRFIAESPESAALWTGRVPNDPQADATFWVDAVVERLGDDFAKVERSTRGIWSCVTLVDGSETPYTWDVCVASDPDAKTLSLAQAFYPNAEAVQRYQSAVAASLTGGAS